MVAQSTGKSPVPWAAIPLFQSLKPAERESLRRELELTEGQPLLGLLPGSRLHPRMMRQVSASSWSGNRRYCVAPMTRRTIGAVS